MDPPGNMHTIIGPLLAALALLVPGRGHADEIATATFNIGDAYGACLDRAQAALQNEGATTIRQAGDVVYGDYGQGLLGIVCEQGQAVAIATAPDEETASAWAARVRDAYTGAAGYP
jgi:cytochrome c5